MKALMKTILSDKMSSRRVRKRSTPTSYVDLHDLKQHFKGKPEFFYNSKYKGPEFTCTHSGANMYAIHSFQEDNPILMVRCLTNSCRISILRGIAHPPM